MSIKQKFLQTATLFFVCNIFSIQAATEEKTETWNVALISEAFGHMIGKNLESVGLQFDIAQVIKGLKDASDGKTSPMSEMEFVQALSSAQAKAFERKSEENLAKATKFLQENKSGNNVVSMEEDKLQYRIDKQGTGDAQIELTSFPKIKFTGTFLDGKVFGSSAEPEIVPLDEAIPGLAKGMLGMKEGEVRTIYIHPELGFGKHGALPPNSLLTFEVEIVQVNAEDEIMHQVAIDPASSTHHEETQAR